MKTREYVLAFARTHDALRAEQALQAAGIAPGVMPLPASIRAGCGLCLRIAPETWPAALRVLAAAGCETRALYLRDAENGGSVYHHITGESNDEPT